MNISHRHTQSLNHTYILSHYTPLSRPNPLVSCYGHNINVYVNILHTHNYMISYYSGKMGLQVAMNLIRTGDVALQEHRMFFLHNITIIGSFPASGNHYAYNCNRHSRLSLHLDTFHGF